MEGEHAAGEKEVIIAPFAKVKDIEKGVPLRSRDGQKMQQYLVVLEASELEPLTEEEKQATRRDIMEQAPTMFRAIRRLVTQEDDLADCDFRIESASRSLASCKRERQQITPEDLEKRPGKVASLEEDIEYYREEIKKWEQEKEQIEQEAGAVRPQLAEWKTKIARLCMAYCKDVEVELADKANQIEESVSQKKEKDVPGQGKETKTVEKKNEMDLPKRKQEFNDWIHKVYCELDPTSVRLIDGNGNPMDMSLSTAARLHEGMTKEIGKWAKFGYYPNRVADYSNKMREIVKRVGVAKEAVDASRNPEEVEKVKRTVEESLFTYNFRALGREVQTCMKEDETILKKVIFETFCHIAIQAEEASLRGEAEQIRRQEQKKGISRLLHGPSRADVKKREEIENYLNATPRQEKNSPAEREYRARDIVADIRLFKEQHGEDVQYQGAIAQLESLEGSLFRCLGISQNGILKSLEKKRAEMANSGMDGRVYRINDLRARSGSSEISTNGKKAQYEILSEMGDRLKENGFLLENEITTNYPHQEVSKNDSYGEK